MAFDLGSLLKDVSDSDTGREQIEYIALDLIDGDAGNFYALSDINQLANNIATVGLQQPLRVRKHPTEAGRYMAVSGHRRMAALEALRKDDPEKWAAAACIVQLDSVSPALQQLRLIFANSDTRKMSSADLNEQTAQVEKLLYQLKEEGYEFPGRMRDHVAKVVKISNTKIATLKMIREHLAECWKGHYKNGALSESTAYELSKLPVAWQESICGQWSGYPRQLTAELVKKFNGRFADVAKIKCLHGSAVCTNTAKMRLKNCKESWGMPCTKCCFDCDSLRTCKDSCAMAASKKKQLKADYKEAERREAQRIEERDRPAAEFAKTVYERIGLARKRSGATVEDLYKAQKKIYSSSIDDPRQKALESGDGKWGPATYLPFGYSVQAASVMVICKVADALKCSVDYLLGRSDIPEIATAVSENPKTSPTGAWFPISVEPPVGKKVLFIDDAGFSDIGKYMGCQTIDSNCLVLWNDAAFWSFLPTEKTATGRVVSESDTGWKTGTPVDRGEYIVLIQFDKLSRLTHQKLTWSGTRWEMRGEAFDIDDAQVRYWIPMPLPDIPEPTLSPLNNSCKTGMSSAGHCGAAAVCGEQVDCCLNCDKDCNLRCGFVEG